MDVKNIFKLVFAIIAIIFIGTIGFYLIEGWSIFDSLYMTVITITTVGYGEVHELSTYGRMFTIILIFFGIGIVALIGSEIAKVLIGRQLESILGRRKMAKELKSLKDHYIICGFGRMGSALAMQLEEFGLKFCIIERDEDRFKLATLRNYPSFLGDPTNDSALSLAGIDRAKGILIILPNDNDNLLITLAAKELNSNIQILTRCDKEELQQRMKTAGANKIVNPLRMGGEQIATIVAQQEDLELKDKLKSNNVQVQGIFLNTYQHFQKERCSIGDIVEKYNAISAVKIETSNGFIQENPGFDQEVNYDDIVVLVMNADREQSHKVSEFKWSNSLSVNISSIDEEHYQLLSIINEIQKSIKNKEDVDSLNNSFEKLIHYTITHFENEENLLRKNKYPDLEAHINEHNKLKEQVKKIHKERKYILSSNVSEFLQMWLTDHIQTSDFKYAEYLAKK